MFSKPKQKKKGSYSQKSLALALKDIREKGQGIRETCRKYKIPRTTIQDRINGRRTDELKTRGPEPILGIYGEKQVVEWLINITKCGFPIKKQELLDTVQKILKDNEKPNPFKNDRPGQTWYLAFLKRNPEISIRSAEANPKARARVTEENIQLWYRELQTFLSESGHFNLLENPERIFNGEESGFSLCPKTGKVLGPTGLRNLYQIKAGNEKDNLTVLVTFNASGLMCPPIVVFPYLRPPKAITDNMPPDWTLGRSESGWMKGEIFFEYVVNDFNAWVEKSKIQKPILLLVDGHKSHMSLELSVMCEQLGIILYALPPTKTHMSQTAHVSVFTPLKAQWEKEVRIFLSKPENLNLTVTENNFCKLFKDIIENPQMQTYIKNEFKRCGLFPFHPNAVDNIKCVKSTMARLIQPRDRTERKKKETEKWITNEDLLSTQKVIRYLRPVLQKKNIDVKLILREVRKLMRKESTEPKVFLETGSEDKKNSVSLLTSLIVEGEISLRSAKPEDSVPGPHLMIELNEHKMEPEGADGDMILPC